MDKLKELEKRIQLLEEKEAERELEKKKQIECGVQKEIRNTTFDGNINQNALNEKHISENKISYHSSSLGEGQNFGKSEK